MSNYKEYQRWLELVSRVELPHWDDLPNFDLYMDQVVALMTEYTGPLGLEAVTPAMINNYVKNKVIVAPAKKKYQVMQIADILLLTLLKQSFSIQEIRSGIDRVTASEYPKQAYDRFIDLLNKKISLIDKSRPDRHAENLTDQLLEAASDMVVDQLETNQLVKIVKNSKSHEPTKIK
ncbi:hypothetical protein S101189_00327 [Pediococcus acidilactici]|uniref:DUF1836 domain-containing protein n=1 Tax=Pediococcus acidilactici TaxID=1254 RepID=UPI0007EF9019|nr:DUF1836 domain-containing protein [Pediococcus acidilactici]ARW23793.1 hypothetical protein S100424_00327 [Pediococcus acidilactici]ARW25803.1 hypothetical protein S100313_00338 [Pediococcus acidilactici]ARW27911.1 hypothetical protein S101189_00327 [Pediococcus acidilactici]OBR28462.1 hypothetical protein SRCM100320_01045 [Pediococcus acidilactici]WDA28299.1 DUF1836 domain-containing protein [Pediococcus acidilactici]